MTTSKKFSVGKPIKVTLDFWEPPHLINEHKQF